MLKAYKYRIKPTEEQKILIAKHFGCVRFIYNYFLDKSKKDYKESKKSFKFYELKKEIPKLKKDFEWLKEVNSQSLQASLKHLKLAFEKFFNKQSGFPKFKSKKNKQSFKIPQNTKVNFDKSIINIPKFKQNIKIDFHRNFDGKIKEATISQTSTGKYFISITVETPDREIVTNLDKSKSIGIDVGIKDYAIISTGEKIANPKHLIKKEKKLKRLSRQHSKKQLKSNNRNKSRVKLAKLHEKVTNCRKDFLHKISRKIVDDNQVHYIFLENLNIKGMMKNHKLSKRIGDSGWHKFKTFLKYKSNWIGKKVIEIDTFAPSSKTCSVCGFKNDNLTLNDRFWSCPDCNTYHDRDINASINIKNFGLNKYKIPLERRKSTLGETV